MAKEVEVHPFYAGTIHLVRSQNFTKNKHFLPPDTQTYLMNDPVIINDIAQVSDELNNNCNK